MSEQIPPNPDTIGRYYQGKLIVASGEDVPAFETPEPEQALEYAD